MRTLCKPAGALALALSLGFGLALAGCGGGEGAKRVLSVHGSLDVESSPQVSDLPALEPRHALQAPIAVHKHPDDPDYLSVGILPRYWSEWRIFDGFSGHRYNGKLFSRASKEALSGTTVVQYGIDRGYPQISTVRRYLDTMGRDVNRDAVVRIREDATPEEIDLTVRAVQAINTALPAEHRIEFHPHPQPIGREPGPNEIIVAFAPIREWPRRATTGPSSVIGLAVPHRDFGAEVYLRNDVIMRPGYHDSKRLVTVVHELVHALGFWSHIEDGIGVSPGPGGVYYAEGSSLMEAGAEPAYGNGGVLHPIDRAALLAAFADEDELGAWNDETLQFHGRLALGSVPIDFGASYRNGHANGWALGEMPKVDLLDADHMLGAVTWKGHLLGFTPLAQPVAGNAQLVIDLDILFGSVAFTELRHWETGETPDFDTGEAWGDGDLKYAVEVRGNTFASAGGRDPGTVTGAFFGPRHEGMGGSLERNDLVAGFGGERPVLVTLVETGSVVRNAPEPDETPDWVLHYHGSPPAEPAQADPPKVWREWVNAIAVWGEEQAAIIGAWQATRTYRNYVDWGFWSTLDGDPLFEITLSGGSAPEGQACLDTPSFPADCAPLTHRIDVAATGTLAGTNPIAGSATWSGYARGVSRYGKPMDGEANLEVDLGAGLVDVHLTKLGSHNFSWTKLILRDGSFSRIDEPQDQYGLTLGSSIAGTFYGPNHEGVAGEFRERYMIGVFGALRD